MTMFKTAPNIAHGAPRGACAEGGQSASGRGGKMFLMVEDLKYAVLTSCSPAAPSTMSFHIGRIVLTHSSKVILQNDVSLLIKTE